MATEAQIAAMAKARAAKAEAIRVRELGQQNQEERAQEDEWSAHLASPEVKNAAILARRKPDTDEAARIAAYSYTLKVEHPDAEPEAPCLDPEIAFDRPVESTDEAPLIAAARQMLKCVELRRGDGTIMNECCQLCEDTGIHHTAPYRCSCGCHPLREALGQ